MNRQSRPFCNISERDIQLNNFLQPRRVREQLQTLLQQIPVVLDNFKTYFVFYHKNPENAEYQQIFSNLQNTIERFGSNLFELLNNVEVNIKKLNDSLICLNSMIFRERQINRRLKLRLGIIEDKSNASSELIYDYKNIYEEGYLRNWALIFSIIIIGVLIKNTYSNGEMSPSVKNMTSNIYNTTNNFIKSKTNV